MAVHDDIVDIITSEITHIGLSDDGATEISGGGYVHLVPFYEAASGGAADLSAPLEYTGTPGQAVTHLIFKRAGNPWVIRPAPTPATFNSNGRLDVISAEITSAYPE